MTISLNLYVPLLALLESGFSKDGTPLNSTRPNTTLVSESGGWLIKSEEREADRSGQLAMDKADNLRNSLLDVILRIWSYGRTVRLQRILSGRLMMYEQLRYENW